MKKWLACCASLLLASCAIRVDDLGPYWNRGVADPALKGKWVTELGKSSEEGSFVNIGGAYEVENLNDKERHHADLLKTLQVGSYRFLMVGPRSTYTLFGPTAGELTRYTVDGDAFIACSLQSVPMKLFLKERHPRDKNIFMHDDCTYTMKGKSGKEMCSDYLEITQLDDKTLKLLSDIPDNETYWECEEVMRKVR